MAKDLKDLFKNLDIQESFKEELQKRFNEAVASETKKVLKEASLAGMLGNIDIENPLRYLMSDPDFRRLVTAWDRKNPDITRAQLLRSFPAAFRDLQGNTLAEPLVDFLMTILSTLAKDTSLMQRLIRGMEKEEDEAMGGGEEELQESFRLMRVVTENAEEYLEKEKYILDSGYSFAFFADDKLMPVDKNEATYKVFVKNIVVDKGEGEPENVKGVEGEEDTEDFTFEVKKMVAVQWSPEYGGVAAEGEKEVDEDETEAEETEVDKEIADAEAAEEAQDEEMVTKLDEYLQYVVGEFVKDNKLAIDQGVKVELAENLINGLKALLFENNIDYSDVELAKINNLEKTIKNYEENINSLYEKNIKLYKENKTLLEEIQKTKRQNVIKETIDSFALTDLQKEKVERLLEMIYFEPDATENDVKNKVKSIVEKSILVKETKDTSLFKPIVEAEEKVTQKSKFKSDDVVEDEILKILKNEF